MPSLSQEGAFLLEEGCVIKKKWLGLPADDVIGQFEERPAARVIR